MTKSKINFHLTVMINEKNIESGNQTHTHKPNQMKNHCDCIKKKLNKKCCFATSIVMKS